MHAKNNLLKTALPDFYDMFGKRGFFSVSLEEVECRVLA